MENKINKRIEAAIDWFENNSDYDPSLHWKYVLAFRDLVVKKNKLKYPSTKQETLFDVPATNFGGINRGNFRARA